MSTNSDKFRSNSNFAFLSELSDRRQANGPATSITSSRTESVQYEHVYVLFTAWNDDRKAQEDIATLRNMFNRLPKTTTDTFLIPNDECHVALSSQVTKFTQEAISSGHNMVVLFYSGCSEMINNRFVLCS